MYLKVEVVCTILGYRIVEECCDLRMRLNRKEKKFEGRKRESKNSTTVEEVAARGGEVLS